MPGFLDKLGKAAQQAAKQASEAAQLAAAESKIRLDIHGLSGKVDDRAQELGRLMFRQHKGETIPEEEYVKILDDMTQLDSQRQAKEAELEALHHPAGAAPEPPTAAPASGKVACPACGAANVAGAKFCTECGKPM